MSDAGADLQVKDSSSMLLFAIKISIASGLAVGRRHGQANYQCCSGGNSFCC